MILSKKLSPPAEMQGYDSFNAFLSIIYIIGADDLSNHVLLLSPPVCSLENTQQIPGRSFEQAS